MKRKIMALLLCASILLTMFSGTVFVAEAAALENGLKYTKYDTYCKITGYSGTETNLVIPSQIEGVPVTKIEEYAFRSCTTLQTVQIPDTVDTIGINAFFMCTGLTRIEIPEGVTSIGNYTFFGCSNLSTVKLPSSLESIGMGTFYQCTALISVELPEGLTTINNDAFVGCSNLQSINIPDSVTSIGENAFNQCTSLASIAIPSGVKTIGEYTFSHCDNLTTAELSYGTTSIGVAAFSYCSKLERMTIPSSVDTIGKNAFLLCMELNTIDFIGTEEQWETLLANSKTSYLSPYTVNYLPAPTATPVPTEAPTPEPTAEPTASPAPTPGVDAVIRSVGLQAKPTKLFYNIGDEFDSRGLVMRAYYTDNTYVDVTEDITITGFDSSEAGSYKVKATYEGRSQVFTVHVLESLRSVGLLTKPSKTFYYVGEEFDSTGLALRAYYNNGTYKDITSGFEITGFDSSRVGSCKVKVTYKGRTQVFTVHIIALNIRSVGLVKKPLKTFYKVGEEFDPTGLTLRVNYMNGTYKDITEGITVAGFDSSVKGSFKVKATYEGRSQVFTVHVI